MKKAPSGAFFMTCRAGQEQGCRTGAGSMAASWRWPIRRRKLRRAATACCWSVCRCSFINVLLYGDRFAHELEAGAVVGTNCFARFGPACGSALKSNGNSCVFRVLGRHKRSVIRPAGATSRCGWRSAGASHGRSGRGWHSFLYSRSQRNRGLIAVWAALARGLQNPAVRGAMHASFLYASKKGG